MDCDAKVGKHGQRRINTLMYMPEYYEELDKEEALKELLLDYEVPRNRVGFLIQELLKNYLTKALK
jgi:hypothetical protein